MLLLRPCQRNYLFVLIAILSIYISRDKNNNEMQILNPHIFHEKRNNHKVNITKKINEKIEQLIIRDPSQWILTHNRWK